MVLECIACNQPVEEQQPYYCQRCFIPTPTYEDNSYIGEETAYCSKCSEPLGENRMQCLTCDHTHSFYDPPQPEELAEDLKIREENRTKLAKEVMADNRMTQQVIEMLGIDHLPREQQGVALSALAREKMNFLSDEYNFSEAHTLVDMGHAITTEIGEDWAIQLTAMRLGIIYYRRGLALQAVKLLTNIYEDAPQETEIEQFRKLELLAHIALAHRLAGNTTLAEEVADQAHEQALLMYQQMEETIEEMIKERSSISEYMGLDESGVSYPRADYIFTIITILTEEAIARGPLDKLNIQETALDRMMELDNMIKILGNISPKDDTTYFSSHLRDYVRIFNGMLWYGDLLLPNAHTRRRFLVEQYFERIYQWTFLIPPHYWLPLRPARFLDIFLRAEIWADFEPDKIIDRLLKTASDEIKPSWHYVLADAYSKVGQLEKAIDQLDIILDEQEDYIQHADDEVLSLAQQLYNSIHLESIGVLVGVADTGSDWISLPLSLQLDEVSDYLEPESYLQSETRPPVLRLSFEQPPEGQTIGVFGEKLLDQYPVYPAIRKVGDRDYTDDDWQSTGHRGTRTDVVVLRTELPDQTLTILFEGQEQKIVQGELQPSPLLLLRGIIHQHEMTHKQVQDVIIDLMAEPEFAKDVTYLFTLKSTTDD